MPDQEKKKAIVFGGTGLVGSHVVENLVRQGYSVTTVSRRKMEQAGITNIVSEVDQYAKLKLDWKDAAVFCCLGSTIKKAGSEREFERIDLEAPLAIANLAKAGQAKAFLLVSALGADAKSRIFYNRTKGRLEQELLQLGLKKLKIFRPSLLLGDRKESRPIERAAQLITNALPFIRILPAAPILAADVALAMVKVVEQSREGTEIFENKEIKILVSL